MQKFLAVLEGPWLDLARAELDAILSLGETEIFYEGTKCVAFRSTLSQKFIAERWALGQNVQKFIGACKAEGVEYLDFIECLKGKKTFAIKPVYLSKGEKGDFDTSLLIQRAGEKIQLDVDLDKPDVKIYFNLDDETIYAGYDLLKVDDEAYEKRDVQQRPFKNPASLNSKLARAMVNLSRVKPGQTVLDPFSGAGGIMIEASLVGAKPIGIELDKNIAKGCAINLEHYKCKDYQLMEGNALDTHLKGIDVIVTDPPYGNSASQFGKEDILERFIKMVARNYSIKRMIIMAPRSVNSELKKNGFKVEGIYTIKSHANLERTIYDCTI